MIANPRNYRFPRWVQPLSVVFALLVPAILMAQARFNDGEQLTADRLNGIVSAITTLAGRVDGLVGDNSAGSTVFVTALVATGGALAAESSTAQGDGIISLVPSNGSFQATTTVVRTAVGGTQHTLVRATGGSSSSFPVRNTQGFSIEATVGASGAANINVYWTPLRGNDPPPVF